MRPLRFISAALVLLAGFLLLSSYNRNAKAPAPVNEYEMNPPISERFTVKQLLKPLANGDNMLVKSKFPAKSVSSDRLTVYVDGDRSITLHDDGLNGDDKKADDIYSAYYKDDPKLFSQRLVRMEENLRSRGSFIQFTGHLGRMNKVIPHFDAAGFDRGNEVQVDAALLGGMDCSADLKKEMSLFITDLSVIEDPARTYNPVTGAGNQFGVWTFRSIITNMANQAATGVSPKAFLKGWIRNYTINQQVNGRTVLKREFVYEILLQSWLRKCYSTAINVNAANWETYWDGAGEADLLRYAPFRLTAIVNRLDLGGNTAYSPAVSNAGETRFIFTLVDLFTGIIPLHRNTDFLNTPFMDWNGMNIIFEFGNIQTSCLQMVNFAKDWLNLSSFPSFPNASYNQALETLTRTVLNPGAAPAKPNGSALNQFRTNEKVMATITSNSNAGWAGADWEMRQFEINAATHLLRQVPVTNTPPVSWNYPLQISTACGLCNFCAPTLSLGTDSLRNWMVNNRTQILTGRHIIPLTYPGSSTPMRAGSALVNSEYPHYWDVSWYLPAGTPFPTPTPTDYGAMRNQLSLNTCQGCHAGETKTMFAHVLPQTYGTRNNYWGATPDFQGGNIDLRFCNINVGAGNYGMPVGGYQFTSAFLTGRKFEDNALSAWADDRYDQADDADDNNMNGLFYVNDPGNYVNPANNNRYEFGYNDLERRKQHLCNLISNGCGGGQGASIVMLSAFHFAPLPPGSH